MSFPKKSGKLVGTIIAASALLLNSAPAFALSQSGLVSGGSIWLETTIAVAMVFVTAMAFSLQIARGYFLRTLEKFTLRLGADIWWLTYVLLRDGLMFMAFVMGLMVFFPGTFQDYSMAVPFMPVSVVLFGAALVTKLYVDADESRTAFRVVTALVFGGAALWIFGTIFVTESPLQLATLPAGVSSGSGFWYSVSNTFSSLSNVDLSMATFDVCFTALGVLGLFGLAHPILHSRMGKPTPKITQAQGPVSPAGLPGRSYPEQPATSRPGSNTASGPTQAAPPAREGVNYIQ
ncbi:MAG: hypothetical protein JRN06_08435 [Nitrososphaerota archaeon]|nr:hypothetical protein [Nitrososphaerota archaeon]MDG7024189.1 hypothetical protein [Nitrososphaerota archaeon]